MGNPAGHRGSIRITSILGVIRQESEDGGDTWKEQTPSQDLKGRYILLSIKGKNSINSRNRFETIE